MGKRRAEAQRRQTSRQQERRDLGEEQRRCDAGERHFERERGRGNQEDGNAERTLWNQVGRCLTRVHQSLVHLGRVGLVPLAAEQAEFRLHRRENSGVEPAQQNLRVRQDVVRLRAFSQRQQPGSHAPSRRD